MLLDEKKAGINFYFSGALFAPANLRNHKKKSENAWPIEFI